MKETIKLFFLILTILIATSSILAQKCKENPASENQYPHCAGHMAHSMNLGEIKELKGKVFYPNGEIPEEVVLELYKVPQDEKEIDPYYFVNNKKTYKTFVTKKDGKFCFKSLPEGRYVVKVGVSELQGMECQHILLTIVKKKLKIKAEPIEIYIPVAI
jgi:hypothetical protein